MDRVIYSIPIEEAQLAVWSKIVDRIKYHGVIYEPRNLFIHEDGARFHLGHEILPFGTRVEVTFLDLYEEYWEIKNRYELVESYKKKYQVRLIDQWTEDYISFDGFNENGVPKFSSGGSLELPDSD